MNPGFLTALVTGSLLAACWHRRGWRWALGSVVLIAATGSILLVRGAEKAFPIGDIALLELYVRNALAGRLLVGPYSRFGWHHPGPLAFYLLAPVYALGGRTTAALGAGAAILTLGALALLVSTARRTLGQLAGTLVFAAAVLYLSRVPELAASAWNPHIVVLPLVALIVASAGAAGGDAGLLPLVAFLASFVAQTDAALVPVVAAVSAGALGGVLRGRHSSRAPARAAGLHLGLAAFIGAACWTPVLLEEVTRTPGNLTLLARFFVAAPSAGQGHGQSLNAAATAWASMLAAPLLPSFALANGGTLDTTPNAWLVIAASAEMAALAIAAWRARTRAPALARVALFAGVSTAIALWSVTRIEERIIDHEVFWISGLGVLNVGVIAAAVVSAVVGKIVGTGASKVVSAVATPAARSTATAPAAGVPTRVLNARSSTPSRLWLNAGALATGILVGAAVVTAFAQVERARDGRLPVMVRSSVVNRLVSSVGEYVAAQHARKPLVRIGEDVWGLTAGVLLEADRRGIPFAVEPTWASMFPESFAVAGDEDAEIDAGNSDEHQLRMAVPGSVAITSFSTTYLDGMPRRH